MNQPTTDRPRIDFKATAERADLRALIVADRGEPVRGKWICPFHPDQSPSLGLIADGHRFKCWACGETGDAIEWVVRRENVSNVEAARRLDPSLGSPDDRRGPRARPAEPRQTIPIRPEPRHPVWRSPDWQAAVEAIVSQTEADLWEPAGRRALDWLRGRGLADLTLRRFRVGFSPIWQASEPVEALRDGDGPQPIKLAPGVVLPWPAPTIGEGDDGPQWTGCNVRRLAADPSAPLPPKVPKYQAIAGSARGFGYPWPELLPTQIGPPALVVEGEPDALIASQEVGDIAHAITVGGATQEPDPSALGFLARCPWLLIATDYDGPGIEAAGRWIARFPHKARRLVLPHGKDIGEFSQVGGDVRAWLKDELHRLGIHPHRERTR